MAPTRTATLRLQLIDAVSGPSKGIAAALKSMDGSLKNLGKASPELQLLINKMENLRRIAGKMDAFKNAARDTKDMSRAFQAARSEVSRLEAALKSSTKPTAKMRADLNSAKEVLKQTAAAFREQVNAKRQAEKELSSFRLGGLKGAQERIRAELKKTTDEIRKQASEQRKVTDPRTAGPGRAPSSMTRRDAATAVLGTTGAYYGAEGAKLSVTNAVEFSRVSDYQRAIAQLTPAEQKPLTEQALKIGKETRFTNPDVVQAQTNIIQAGVRDRQVVMAMMDHITDYALAMGTTLEEATETVRGGMQQKNKDLTNPATAAANTQEFVNYLVQMAKRGGMNDDDVRQYLKYSGAPTTAIGLPDDLTAAIGIILRRGGLRGDEAGVFGRAAASKLVAPTNKGRDAMAAMGIDYDAFTKMGGLRMNGLETVLRQKFGKTMTEEMKAEIQEIIDDGVFMGANGEELPIVGDRGQFTTAVSGVLGGLFADKKGKVAAADAKALAKAIGDYHKFSVESVDTIGLLYEIMKSNPTQGQLEALFTSRQAGRATVLAQRWGQVEEERGVMNNTPGNLANRIGREANSGLYGDWTRMLGSFETLFTTVGQDWEGVIRPVIRTTSDLVDSFGDLPKPLRQVGEAAAAAAIGLGLLAVGSKVRGLLGGVASTATGTVTGAAATGARGFLGKLLASRGNLYTLAAITGYSALNSVPHAGYESATKNNPNLLIDMENARRRQLREQPLGFEGGMHRVGTGFGPAAGIATQLKQDLSVKATPTIDGSAILNAAQMLRARLLQMLSIRADVKSTLTGNSPGGTTLGHRANGGHVQAGRSYIVGERGKEIITMGGNGYVTPNTRLASTAAGNTNHFHIASNDPQAVAREISKILDRQLARSRQVSINGLPVTV